MAFLAAVVSTVLGAFLGLAAGFLGGWVDATVSRIMDFLLAFPQLLFSIALVSVLPDSFFGLDGRVSRMAVLIGVIGFFGWPYIGRIVRGQVLSLREREFIEASRSLGARTPRILFRELLPNLAAPILVYTTLIIPTNIITEASLSFLGVGIEHRTPPGAACSTTPRATTSRTRCTWSFPACASSSRFWPSTSSATGCGTPSTRRRTRALTRTTRGPRSHV